MRRLAALLLPLVLGSAACGACGRSGGVNSGAADGAPSPRSGPPPADAGAAAARDHAAWKHALDGGDEDLAALAVHEGAAGLVEASNEPGSRKIALRAMAFARGWAQLPTLATVAAGDNEEDARVALDVMVDLAARPLTTEDPEDAEELREGCEKLLALARDKGRPRERRLPALRALRMMPCPASDAGAMPTAFDAK